MLPAYPLRLDRIRACVCDLRDNGIDLSAADAVGLARAVHEHLDYFQLMLGYDSDAGEVLQMLKERSSVETQG